MNTIQLKPYNNSLLLLAGNQTEIEELLFYITKPESKPKKTIKIP